MDYELKKSKREKASIVPIEEVYTDLDIKENDPYEPSVGYRFDTSRRWSQDKSRNKSIGIRDLKLTPSSGDFRCRFIYYNKAVVPIYPATWDTDHYDIDYGNPNYSIIALNQYFISSEIVENIIPSNGFEEIINDLLRTQLSGNVWKRVNYNQNGKGLYRTYASSNSSELGALFAKESDDTKIPVSNKRHFPIPSTFNYYYDSNLSSFELYQEVNYRVIYMENSRVASRIEPNAALEISNEAYKPVEVLEEAGSAIDKVTHGYFQEPCSKDSGLLMLISLNDKNSLSAVYKLFNQSYPKDLNTLAQFQIDNKYYYVPFVYDTSNDVNSFAFYIGNTPFTSKFRLTTKNKKKIFSDPVFTAVNDLDDKCYSNLVLNNVWDRLHLLYHASFAETRARIIGRNGDHWDSPNKRFIVPGADQDEFYLKFTTDGKHNILPIGCHFNVDLCFMLNTTNNTATGNHDMFK